MSESRLQRVLSNISNLLFRFVQWNSEPKNWSSLISYAYSCVFIFYLEEMQGVLDGLLINACHCLKLNTHAFLLPWKTFRWSIHANWAIVGTRRQRTKGVISFIFYFLGATLVQMFVFNALLEDANNSPLSHHYFAMASHFGRKYSHKKSYQWERLSSISMYIISLLCS